MRGLCAAHIDLARQLGVLRQSQNLHQKFGITAHGPRQSPSGFADLPRQSRAADVHFRRQPCADVFHQLIKCLCHASAVKHLGQNPQSLWFFCAANASNRCMLNTVIHDGPAGTPLLIAHGLFGSARNWGVIAKRLSATRRVITVDMRNHADSPWFDSHSYTDMANDLAMLLDQPMDVLGHSMGGKAAMVLALQSPALIRKLIVADIAPVSYSHSQMGPIAAMRGIDLNTISSRSDAKSQLDELEPGVADFLLQSLDMKTRQWRLNLDVLASEMDKIIGFPDVTGRYDGPTLFLSGATSDYVQRDARPHIKSLFPAAKFAKIPGAGHWLHAEKPREFEAAVTAFLG